MYLFIMFEFNVFYMIEEVFIFKYKFYRKLIIYIIIKILVG